MIVHRRKVDVRFGDDVAQRDVAKTAVGIEPFGGGKNGGAGLIAWHVWSPRGELPFKRLYETIV